MNYIWIFIGGGLGSITRYEIGQKITGVAGAAFPFGTLGVNIISCFILGALGFLFALKGIGGHTAKLLIGVGFCGGFSTFSAFTSETFELLKTGNYIYSGANILLSMAFCLLSFWAGWSVSKLIL